MIDLLVGDIIELKKILMLLSEMFNQMEQTDWKFRKAQGIIHQKEEINIFQNRAYAQYEPPSKLIYNFQDIIHTGKRKEGLNLEKTQWASIVVPSMVMLLYCRILNNFYNNNDDETYLYD